MRAVVLVEGESDRVALLTLAACAGADLAGHDVVAMGGITNLRAHLAALPDGVVACGLYDAPAAGWVRRVTAEAGVPADRFHACDVDLEDELLRALGVEAVERVVAGAGEARALRRLGAMPAQRGWSHERLHRRFLTSRGGRKARYAELFVRALVERDGAGGVPAPLRRVLGEVHAAQWDTCKPTGKVGFAGMERRPPDFFVIGAPKAGTSALHSALAQHPQLFLSSPKEPKYYMCGDSPPPAYKGPGDAHSNQEWIWQRERYLELFDGAGEAQLTGESTPFYLYNRDARRRLAADRPDAKLVAVLRDPVDRAYSNWMHLWMDGLEPRADIVEAVRREQRRIDDGWAPFWHYSALGMYGRQVADLFDHFPREQVLLLRYRELVETPDAALGRVFDFLGVRGEDVQQLPSDNSRPFVKDGVRARTVGPVIRAGAAVGQFLPPQVWRKVSKPLISQLQKGGEAGRPRLTPEQRNILLRHHLEDIARLEEVTGESFQDWRSYRDGGSYATRSEASRLASSTETGTTAAEDRDAARVSESAR